MKIYFAGSIRGGRDDQELYRAIIAQLRSFGEVLTEHVGRQALTDSGESLPVQQIFERDVAWIQQADALVAECTQPSTGVGYEIGLAESLGKPVLALFRPSSGRRLSGMVEGNTKVVTATYDDISQVAKVLQKFFSTLQ